MWDCASEVASLVRGGFQGRGCETWSRKKGGHGHGRDISFRRVPHMDRVFSFSDVEASSYLIHPDLILHDRGASKLDQLKRYWALPNL